MPGRHFFFLLGGFAYCQLATKVYQLEARLETLACDTSGAKYVGWDCGDEIFNAAQAILSATWGEEFAGSMVSFSAARPIVKLQMTDPRPFAAYQEALDHVILSVADNFIEEADQVQAVLARPNLADVSQSDVASQARLKSEIVASLVRETSGTIGSFVILPSSFTVPVSPKTNLIMALSLVLGGFLGAAGVLLRKVIRDRALAA